MIARNDEMDKKQALKSLLRTREAVSLAELSHRLGLDAPTVRGILERWVRDKRVGLLIPVGGEHAGARVREEAVFYRWLRTPDNRPHETWLQRWMDQVNRSRLGTMVNKLGPY